MSHFGSVLRNCRFFVFTLLLLFVGLEVSGQTLVPYGADWKYLDDGSDQGTAWRQPSFDDAGWPSGPAQLGYGDGDESTVVSFGNNSSQKHITTYFRHEFTVTAPVDGLSLSVIRDDGIVVYLNGTEVFRDAMPAGPITADTFAQSTAGGSEESTPLTAQIDQTPLLDGDNTLAVEIHQVSRTSSDISFDLQLLNQAPPAVTRGPYLQQASADGIVVRWRTAEGRDAVVRYGTDPDDLVQSASDPAVGTEHAVSVAGLNPNTRYYYSIGDSSTELAGGPDYYFDTHPVPGTEQATRIWILGDSGTANENAAAVRDAYIAYNGGPHADVWLMLGDNAYPDGTDAEYQSAVFDMYPQSLRSSVLWPTLGNHDGHTADSTTQSGPYYDIFTLPANAESGGLDSGTEAYYSFDYANIHFICLDSYDTDRSANGAMATWLQNDLAATTQEWIIAYWHHPPYSKGSHDSDSEGRLIDMREIFLPILESYGVDLVLGGHSHSYERSMLIDSHYGSSSTFDSIHIVDGGDGDPLGSGAYSKLDHPNGGAVYSVAGSSGKTTDAALNHPVMITNLVELGSLVIDVSGRQLDAVFLDDTGAVRDAFRLIHASAPMAPSDLSASALSASEIALVWTDNATYEDTYTVQRSVDQSAWSTVGGLGPDAQNFTDSGLDAATTYYYRVFASNAAGDSAPSNTASATTDAAPDFDDYFATAETPVDGTVNGTFASTHAADGIVQSITEVESGGKPANRRSLLEHRWQFSLQGGAAVTLFAHAYSSGSTDGDDFEFAYSLDAGSSWQTAFTVTDTGSQNVQSAPLPATANGTVLVRVRDSDRTQGNRALDQIVVDALRIRVETVAGDPPVAPDNLAASAISSTSVALSWDDNAADELGFEIERKPSTAITWTLLESLPADTVSHTDSTAAPDSAYSYRVRAYNASGSSPFSNEATATTPVGISLSVSGDKIKGVIHNTLSWSNASGEHVAIYRNGAFLTTVPNSGSSIDDTGQKGNGAFSYIVCEASGSEQCSNEASVSF